MRLFAMCVVVQLQCMMFMLVVPQNSGHTKLRDWRTAYPLQDRTRGSARVGMHGCMRNRSSDSAALLLMPCSGPGCGCTPRSNPPRSWSQQAVVMCRHIAASTPLMITNDSLYETEFATWCCSHVRTWCCSHETSIVSCKCAKANTCEILTGEVTDE